MSTYDPMYIRQNNYFRSVLEVGTVIFGASHSVCYLISTPKVVV
jgi:hypothetical protein